MATLEKIRSKAGLLVLVVGVALFAFIIGDFLNSGSTYFRQSQEKVAEVDGEVIKIQEFQDRVDEMTEMYKMQTGSTSLPEEYQTALREAADEASSILTDLAVDMAAEKKQVFVDAGCEIIEPDITEWQAAVDGFLAEKYPYLTEYADMITAADPA